MAIEVDSFYVRLINDGFFTIDENDIVFRNKGFKSKQVVKLKEPKEIKRKLNTKMRYHSTSLQGVVINVSRLIWLYHNGLPEKSKSDYIVKFKDGNVNNMNISNLELVSNRKSPNNAFSKNKVIHIRKQYANTDVSPHDLAKEYNVSLYTMRQLLRGVTYVHVGGPIIKNKTYKKVCEGCGKSFDATRPSTRYCHHRCSARVHDFKKRKIQKEYEIQNLNVKTCKFCNNEFQPTKISQNICGSESCKKALKRLVVLEAKNLEEKTCPICNNIFMQKRKNQTICNNNKCKKQYSAMTNRYNEVREIRNLYNNSQTKSEEFITKIADKFNRNLSYVKDIIAGRKYSSVGGPINQIAT